MPGDANLFGLPPKKKPAKAAPAPSGTVQAAIGLYVTLFNQRFADKPVITPADGKAVKQLITQFGAEKVMQRLPWFMAMEDSYLFESGYPLRLFPGQWNRLTVQLQRRPSMDRAVERTSEYLRKLRTNG